MVFQAIQLCLALQALGYPRADYAFEHMSYVMEASEAK